MINKFFPLQKRCCARAPAKKSPQKKAERHVGGILLTDGRRDHDTSYRVNRPRRMVGMIARSWARGQKDKKQRSSRFSFLLRLRVMKAHVDPIFSFFLILGHGLSPSFVF